MVRQGTGKRHGASKPTPGTHTLPGLQRKLLKPWPFGVLQWLHYTGMTEEIIGPWQLIQSLAPLPSLEVRAIRPKALTP